MAGGTRSYELARRLVSLGHEVNMITAWRGEDGQNGWCETNEAGIRVHWIAIPYSKNMSYRARIWSFIKFALFSARKAASMKADVVFASSTPLTIALPAFYAGGRRNVPVVFEVRDLWPDVIRELGIFRNNFLLWVAARLEKFAYKASAHIIALTPTMRDFLSGKGVPLSKITSIPNFANMDQFDVSAKGGRFRNKKMLLYCGSLGPSHGPEFLVELAKYFYDKRLALKIEVVGDGMLLDELRSNCENYGCLDKSIIFHGSKPKKQVAEFYLRADASIMTFADCELLYRHSVQNKFFDSLAAGRPIISNYRGYASEVAETVKAGLIIDRRDIAKAAVQIQNFIMDENRVYTAGENARLLAKCEFDADMLAQRLERVLASVISANPR